MWNVVAICLFGFLRNFNPDNQYMSNIFNGPLKNFTVEEATQDIYPVYAYSNVPLTLVSLLVTDILRYKPLIIMGAAAGLLSRTTLFLGYSRSHMQVMEFFNALMRSTNVAYRTYIYTQVDKSNFQMMTAIISIMPKAGFLFSSLLAQALLYWELASLENLIELTIGALCLALLVGTTLPPVKKDLISTPQVSEVSEQKQAAQLLWPEFKQAFTNPYVLKWCIWWVINIGSSYLVVDFYIQALWSEVSGHTDNRFNGGVDVIFTVLSVVLSYTIGCMEIDWRRHGDLALGACTLVEGICVIVCAKSSSLILSYVLYVVYSVLFDIMLVVCHSEVALQLKNKSFGLIFGTNIVLTLIVWAFLTYLLSSKQGLTLPIRIQFMCIGWLFTIIGICYLAKFVSSVLIAQKQLLKIQKPKVSVAILDTVTLKGYSSYYNKQ